MSRVQDSDDDILFGPSAAPSQSLNPILPINNNNSGHPTTNRNQPPPQNYAPLPVSKNEDYTFLFEAPANPPAITTANKNQENINAKKPSASKKTNIAAKNAWVPRAASGASFGYKVVFTPPTKYEIEQLEKQIDYNRIAPRGGPKDVSDAMSYSKPPSANDDAKQKPLLFSELTPTAQTYFVSTSQTCYFCNEGEKDPLNDPLFKPCPCNRVWHRHSCFRKWRASWISPRNYFSCPDCLYNYNMERIKSDKDSVSKEQIQRKIYCEIGKLWTAILFAIGAFIAIIASIAYGADRQDKNVPIIIKALLTSVVYGFPNSNATTAWRAEFKDPNVSVSQYYGMLGGIITACIVLCFASCTSVDFSNSGAKDHNVEADSLYLANEKNNNSNKKRKQNSAAIDAAAASYPNAYATTTTATTNIVVISSPSNQIEYFSDDENDESGRGNPRYSRVSNYESRNSRPVDNCCYRCHCSTLDCYYCSIMINNLCCAKTGSGSLSDQCCQCVNCCSEMRCDCGSLPFGGGDCISKDTDVRIIAVVIVVAIAVILVSAIFVVFVYGSKKAADVHRAMAKMIEEQQYELEGQTVVLGMGESLRPVDAV